MKVDVSVPAQQRGRPSGRGALIRSAAAMTALTVASGAVARAEPAEERGRIVVLGDSLAVSPSSAAGFPAELQRRLARAGSNLTVVNAGIRGDKTAGGVRRVHELLTPATRVLVVELGANDGLRGVELAEIERNLSTIIEAAQRRGIAVLLCGMMVPPRFGWDYAMAFPQMFQRLAATYQVPLVPFILEGVALNPDLNGPDGIHPNAEGARRIAETVWKHLAPMIAAHAEAAGRSGSL
jgi:acyl-CoA thioesterase I